MQLLAAVSSLVELLEVFYLMQETNRNVTNKTDLDLQRNRNRKIFELVGYRQRPHCPPLARTPDPHECKTLTIMQFMHTTFI